MAKETCPNAPQLYDCRPLVGQDYVPTISATTSPTEGVLAQISIVEIELRNGSHIDSLTGTYDELMRLANNRQMPPQNWNHQRLFVSPFFTFFDFDICLLRPSSSYFTVSLNHSTHYFVLLAGNLRSYVPRAHQLLRD